MRGDGVRIGHRHQHGVAVGRRLGDEVGCDRGRSTRAILDHHWLAPQVCELAGDHSGHDVGSAARSRADENLDRLGRKRLGRHARAGQRGCKHTHSARNREPSIWFHSLLDSLVEMA